MAYNFLKKLWMDFFNNMVDFRSESFTILHNLGDLVALNSPTRKVNIDREEHSHLAF
jgi:hypothetical protein